MSVVRVVLAAVLAGFVALTVRVLTEQSYGEFLETATANAATGLLFLDLIACLGAADLLLEGPRRAGPHTLGMGTLQSGLEMAAAERIRAAQALAEGRRAEAASILGIDRTTLFRWMKRLGL